MSKQLDKHPGGRPTVYTPRLVKKARKYVTDYESQGDVIPSVVGLCKYITRSRACIYRWASELDKAEFKDILEDINETQKQVLLNKGLSGEFNSNIAKLVLGKHGLHERKELSGPDGKPIPMIGVSVSADEASRVYSEITKGD